MQSLPFHRYQQQKGYQDLMFDDGAKLKAIFVGQIDFNSITKNFEEILLQFKAYREGDL